ncbi:hypothetical protein [Halomonas sp. IOP_14]|nr:hypothetical protein [Halomonas sp. IOP_14]
MDGMSWFLLGVLAEVFIAVACAAGAFCSSVEKLNNQGERNDG